MIANRADELILREEEGAMFKADGQEKSVTKSLTGPQIIALIKEIAPEQASQNIDERSPTKFQYVAGDGVFAVRAMIQAGKWNVSVVVDDKGQFARQTGMFKPVDLPPEDAEPVRTSRKSVKMPSVEGDRARIAMEQLLRTLVSEDGSDLHLRVGEPPILRKHGEMIRIEGQEKLTSDQIDALLLSITPERNKKEYAEHNDSDFAYEIEGIARFRSNCSASVEM
ncbi:MAG: hypothetical protein O2973_10130 [Gemmatimonadetes bacterium]|nr:hypothetical protein [Gemmatimonadota bacterium]